MGNEPKNTHGLYGTILSPEFLRTFPLFVGSCRGFVGHCFSDLPHHQTWNSREASGGQGRSVKRARKCCFIRGLLRDIDGWWLINKALFLGGDGMGGVPLSFSCFYFCLWARFPILDISEFWKTSETSTREGEFILKMTTVEKEAFR